MVRTGLPVKPCTHAVGAIGKQALVPKDQWNATLIAHCRDVLHFNEHGQRAELPHPGLDHPFAFCPYCGERIDRDGLLTFAEALAVAEQHPNTEEPQCSTN